MGIPVPDEDEFEDSYTDKFNLLARKYGIRIDYHRDRAALDAGLHLTTSGQTTDTRVWFQFKGKHAEKFPLEMFQKLAEVPVSVGIEHLRAWYRSPEPVYLIVYIDSADTFLAQDVKVIVNKQWGDELLNPAIFPLTQKTTTVKIPTTAVLNETMWEQMYNHRSMRTDGLSYRGQPLAHSHDPLTSILLRMEPELFTALIYDLISEHGYKIEEELDATPLFADSHQLDNTVALTCGTLFQRYEICPILTRQFISDNDGYRDEGQFDYAQGRCAVLIHSRVATLPDQNAIADLAKDLFEQRNIRRLLVFINDYFIRMDKQGPGCCWSAYTQVGSKADVSCTPQHLDDLGYNICVTTNTYNRFRDKISWYGGTLWEKEHPSIYIPAEIEFDNPEMEYAEGLTGAEQAELDALEEAATAYLNAVAPLSNYSLDVLQSYRDMIRLTDID